MQTPPTRQLVGMHFYLECYVTSETTTAPSPFEGWATFTQIFQKRPNKARFAVARMVPLVRSDTTVATSEAPAGDWMVWDFYASEFERNTRYSSRGLLAAPVPLWQGDSLDGLIMKAMHLYERPHD